MLLIPKCRKGSLCLELLIYLPLLLALFLSLIFGQLFFIESLCLDQATYETAKSLVSLEIASTAFESMLNEQTGTVLSALWGLRLSGAPARELILAHDTSGYLVEENMEEVGVMRRDGMLQVFCRYRSAFLPDVYIESRAAERSWKP